MTGSNFKAELSKLENLLSGLDKSGGAKRRSAKKSAKKSGKKSAKRSVSPKRSAKRSVRHSRRGGAPASASRSNSKSRSPSRSPPRSRSSSRSRSASPHAGEDRHFKLVSVDGKVVEDGGRYELPGKTRHGRVNLRGPRDVASKVFSQLCMKHKRRGDCKFTFAIQETTRDTHKKVYHYEGKRVALSRPETYEVKDKRSGRKTKIVRKYKNVLKSLGSEHSKEQKGGWSFYS